MLGKTARIEYPLPPRVKAPRSLGEDEPLNSVAPQSTYVVASLTLAIVIPARGTCAFAVHSSHGAHVI